MAVAPPTGRPRLGVVKLTSCDGCQLTLLDLEDELLELAARIDIVEFPEASSRRSEGPFDILLVEGSVSTPSQAVEIRRLRRAATRLVTIGACAQTGGVQALRNWLDLAEVRAAVYPRPEHVASLEHSAPVSDFVAVDYELPGCPVSPAGLREVLTAFLIGRRPQLADEAVCLDCKRRGIVCLLAAGRDGCLGPVTRAGCGALCPGVGRGCFGCFGPRASATTASLALHAPPGLRQPLPLMTAWAPGWQRENGSTGELGDARH
jgi:coenzyme F420-reducing hydrogenase gamma subunit